MRIVAPLLRNPCRGDPDPGRLVAPTRRARGREVRRVGLDEEPVGRHEPHALGGRLLALPEAEAGDRDRAAQLEGGSHVVGGPRDRVEDRRGPVTECCPRSRAAEPGSPHLREQVILGVATTNGTAAVEDRRLPELNGKSEVAAQVGELVLDRREEPVVVQPGLPDGNHGRVADERGSPTPAGLVRLGGRVRMDPCCSDQARVGGDHLDGARARGLVPAGDEEPLHAGELGGGEDVRQIVGELRRLEVGVRVDEAHQPASGASISSRGKSGLGTARVPGSAAWAPQVSSSRSGGPPAPRSSHGYS